MRVLRGSVEYPFPPPALSAAEIDAGYILMCLARPTGDLVIDLHQPAELEAIRPRKLPCRVQSRQWLAHDVLGLSLKLPRDSGFRYLPGQYIDLLLDDGKRRSFSIASAPGGDALELHIRVTPGGKFAHWAAHEDWVYAIAVSADGKWLATGDWAGNVRLWDVETGVSQLILHGHDGRVNCIAYSQKGDLLASLPMRR